MKKQWEVSVRPPRPQTYYEGMIGEEIERHVRNDDEVWIKLELTFYNERNELKTEQIWFLEKDLEDEDLF